MIAFESPVSDPADLALNALVDFCRKWNASHSGHKISSVTFSFVTTDGNLFPTVCKREVKYRDLYPKGRSIVGGDDL